MSRAVFLSSGGDPFISMLVLKLFQERWYNEVDKFYICYNNHSGVPLEVAQEFISRAIAEPKVELIYHPRGIGNGMPITEMAQIAKEDLVMLLEDDGFIFESGQVDKCFQKIESDLCDVVGSPRGSCGQEVWEASAKKYNLDYSGYGDQGPNVWPNFMFVKRKDLLKTDLDFGSHTWQIGEYSKELDHTFQNINHGDTAVWMCVQLRALGLRFQSVPQHHASPFEIDDQIKEEQNWHPTQQPFKWIHGGSLSSGWGGYLSNQVPDTSNDSAKQEIETRVAFWTIASSVIDGFTEFKYAYQKGIESLIQNADLDRDRIGKKIGIYRALMKI